MNIPIDRTDLAAQAHLASALAAHLANEDYTVFAGLLRFLDALLAVEGASVPVVFSGPEDRAPRKRETHSAPDTSDTAATHLYGAAFGRGDVRVAVSGALDEADDRLAARRPDQPGELPLSGQVFAEVAALFRLACLIGAHDLARYAWDILGRMTEMMAQESVDYRDQIPWPDLGVPCPRCQGRTPVPAPAGRGGGTACPRCEGSGSLTITELEPGEFPHCFQQHRAALRHVARGLQSDLAAVQAARWHTGELGLPGTTWAVRAERHQVLDEAHAARCALALDVLRCILAPGKEVGHG